jgi:hypothetical protein
MKKYIGLLIVLGILTFGATKVQAVVSVDNNMGCLPSYRYSPMTGQPCLGNTLPVDQARPSITLISPNGGEVYQEGQDIEVKWESKNIPADKLLQINIHGNGSVAFGFLAPNGTLNDGREIIKLDPKKFTDSKYKIIIGVPMAGFDNSALSVFDQSDDYFSVNKNDSNLDITPRIMYWYGKVNQHVDANGNWQTDPDGISGADLDKLTYCKKWFPRTIRVQDYKLETTNGWRNRGNVDAPYTSTKMSTKCVQGEGMVIPIPVDNPVISGISGPQFLDINSVGTWKVEAYNPTGGNLSYKVDWGDTYEYCPVGGPCTRALSLVEAPFGQSATFTHSYSRAGIYNPTFTVRNDKGGTATTSLSVKVGKTDSSPSITIISPNGGEVFRGGEEIKVKWESKNIPKNELVAFYLDVPTGESLNIGNQGQFETINDGIEVIKLPIISPNYGNQFKMHIVHANNSLTAPQDVSDNYFTIKNSEVNPIPIGTYEDCTAGSVYSRTTGQRCLLIESNQNVCCEIFGYGAGMIKTPSTYAMMSKNQCSVANGLTGGGRNIVDNSFCKTTTSSVGISPTPNSILAKGITGNEVKAVQTALTKQGYTLSADGKFGPKTEEAIKRFQATKSLPVTGIVDDTTMSLILSYILEL